MLPQDPEPPTTTPAQADPPSPGTTYGGPPTSAVPEPVPSVPGHTDAWWHAVSICEQGGQNNPFFGYFSIMDGSAGGKSWDEQVQMANAIIARAGDGAWAASCVAAGYAASPGG